MEDGVQRELHVLGHKVELPAVVAFHDLAGEEEPGSADVAARVKEHAGAVEEARLAHEPQGSAGGHPVVDVLGVAVARQDAETGVETLVHLADVPLVEQVVGVEDEEGVVALRRALERHPVEQVRQRVALADVVRVVPFVHVLAQASHQLCGMVCAVVGHQPDVDKVLRVIVRPDRGDEVANDFLLVASADEHGVALVGGRVREDERLGEQAHGDVEDLVDNHDPADDG